MTLWSESPPMLSLWGSSSQDERMFTANTIWFYLIEKRHKMPNILEFIDHLAILIFKYHSHVIQWKDEYKILLKYSYRMFITWHGFQKLKLINYGITQPDFQFSRLCMWQLFLSNWGKISIEKFRGLVSEIWLIKLFSYPTK